MYSTESFINFIGVLVKYIFLVVFVIIAGYFIFGDFDRESEELIISDQVRPVVEERKNTADRKAEIAEQGEPQRVIDQSDVEESYEQSSSLMVGAEDMTAYTEDVVSEMNRMGAEAPIIDMSEGVSAPVVDMGGSLDSPVIDMSDEQMVPLTEM